MDIKAIVSQLTLEEKASLCSGIDSWRTKPIPRLSIPSAVLSDGPHGLRKEVSGEDGKTVTVESVCFPTGGAAACSFDRSLIRRMGEALGEECQAENVHVILGPAVNIKRSPLCGRNFEYLSEDPYLAGEMAASYIQGVESQGVGTSLKHFAANNQENRRMTVSAEIDERTLREIYLAGFETAVKKGRPATVMCSYNKINGVYSSENKRLLTDILREEWGFEGLVMSDWGAVNRRPDGVLAGLDLEMPASHGENDAEIVRAVKEGRLREEDVDTAAERVLQLVCDSIAKEKKRSSYSKEEHHALARKIAADSMVLLKNENHILPLNPNQKIAFIGKFADTPRYQGGGSSHINCCRITGALEAAEAICPVSYAQGYILEEDRTDEVLLKEAVEAAKAAEVAVIFAGLPDAFESEGYDRPHMKMPQCQNRLIEAVCEVQKHVVVVLHNGAPVEMPWAEKAEGILESYLGGQAVGGAQIDILFGKVNPSGKLAETLPLKLSDNPSYLNFPGEKDRVEYREGIFVGYRYYDKKEMEVLYPFGYGLSYTTFSYSGLKADKTEMTDTDTLQVSVTVTNTGDRAGKEVVQLYTGSLPGPEKAAIRPIRELKGFEKVELLPGESKEVTFTLDKRAFAFYDPEIPGWYVEDGAYEISVGKSSRELTDSVRVTVHPAAPVRPKYTMESSMEDLLKNAKARAGFETLLAKLFPGEDPKKKLLLLEASMKQTPIHSLCSFHPSVTLRELEEVVEKANR